MRPAKYKKEHCQDLISHMEKGLSFCAFAGTVGVHRDTLQRWLNKYPEFMEARKYGDAASLLFWEKLGILGARGKINNFNVTSWIFNMKNRHGWRDRQEIDHSNKDGTMKTVIILPDNKRG